MNCIQHPERNAAGTCAGCGGGICEFCRTVVEGKTYCPPCVDKMLASPAKAASKPAGQSAAAATPKVVLATPSMMGQATPYAPRPAGSQATPYAARSAGAPALAGEVVEGGSKISALWMFIVSACGALVLGGVFMPWASVTVWIFTASVSGWDLVSSGSLVGVTIIEPYLLIAGAALMLACALPATVLAFTSAESRDTVRTLAKVSSFGAGLVFGVIIWAIVDVIGEPEFSYIAYGVWVILVAAIVGLVASIFMSRWGGGQSRFYLSKD
jgi:hypothetical protein